MERGKTGEAAGFVGALVVYQVLTYFVFGFVASSLIDYARLFTLPVMRDYYHPFGSVSNLLGPALQVIRGAMFGLILLPFRGFLRERASGWLMLWLLFVGIGILGTPAAAPASIEGMVYSKLPLWFHLIGMPEVLLQTLVFSLLVHRKLRAKDHPLSPGLKRLLGAFSAACIAFMGYTVISLGFAFAAGVGVEAGGADPRVLGQFAAPLVISFLVALFGGPRVWMAKHLAMYLCSAAVLALYQGLILGSASLVYVLIAPVLPVLISMGLSRPKKPDDQGMRKA